MNRKMLFIMLVSLSYLTVSLSYIDSVSASTTSYFLGFEGTVIGTPLSYTNSSLSITSQLRTGTFEIDGISFRTGSRCFSTAKGTTQGWFNLSYPSSYYLTNISYYWRGDPSSHTGTSYRAIYFYNQTYQGAKMSAHFGTAFHSLTATQKKDAMVTIGEQLQAGYSNYACYVDSTGTAQTFGVMSGSTLYRKWYMNINNALGNARYYYVSAGAYYEGTISNSTSTSLGLRIDRIYFQSNTGSGITDYAYIDDMYFTLSSSYTVGGGGTGTENDFSIYETLGSYPSSYVQGTGALACETHEQMYNQYFSGSIYGFDIFNFNAFDSSYKLDWQLSINGMSYTPTSTYNLTIAGVPQICHVYRFDFVSTPLVVANEKLLLELYNPFKIVPNLKYSDVDGDGFIEMKYGNDLPDNVYNGDYTTPVLQFDYILYYIGSSGSIPEDTISYNVLQIYNQRGMNGTRPLYYVNDTVLITYGLSSILVSNQLRLKRSSTYQNYSGFPKTLYDAKGNVGFRANKTGNMNISLWSNSVLSRTKLFDVIPNPNGNSYEVSTSPPLTYDFNKYDVSYRYYSPLGYNGYLGVYRNISDLSNITANGIVPLRLITPNSTGIFTFIHQEKFTNHYWQLFSLANGVYYPVGDMHIHYIIDTLSYNYIGTSERSYLINTPFSVFGSNTLTGGNVWIYVNDYPFKDISGKNSFIETYSSTKATTLIFKLNWLLDNGTLITLYTSDSVQITTTPTGTGGGNQFQDVLDSIPPIFKYFAGIVIIIVSTLSPLLILSIVKGNREFNLSSIPQFLYLICAIIGFVLAIILGFFPLWSIAVLVLLAGLIIAIMWMKGGAKE